MKTMGKTLIIVAFMLFVFGAFSFKVDMDNEQKDLFRAFNEEEYLYPEQVQELYRNRYIFDGIVIVFGAVSLIVGGSLLRKAGNQ